MEIVMEKKYNIGCSGFYYKDWVGAFYPEDLNKKEWLDFYAQSFDTVEINNSFYRMPKETTVQGWYDRTPADFLFTLKGSRYVTHIKRLKDPKESLSSFYHLADILAEKLGCILWQLPPTMKKDPERLINFCKATSPEYNNVVEFRHNSWFDEETYDILREYKVAYCIISAPKGLPENIVTTADFSYVRFHGKENWYDYDYSDKQLSRWKQDIESIDAKRVFIYFNNDVKVRAVKNAKTLKQMLAPVNEKIH